MDHEDQEEIFFLRGRDLPDLPPPRHGAGQQGGWEAIDRLGAEASFLVQLPLLEEVSEQHKSAWARAHSEVLQRWKDASTPEEVDRALMWLGFLPQALNRKPCGRSGKIGRAQVAYRYNCLTSGDWGALVELWERDTERESRRPRRRKERSEQEEQEMIRLRKDVMGLFTTGKVGQGMRRIVSHGVADSHDPAVKAELQEKFLPRRHDLPDSVKKMKPIESFRGLRQSLLSLEPGKSPGSGGMRPEYLVALGDRLEQAEVELLEQFGLAYTAGELPPWFYRLWLTMQTVPLYKTAQQDSVRPLGIRHTLPRLFHAEVMAQCKEETREFLEPQQLGQSKAGAAKLAHSIRGLLEKDQNLICIKLDVKNCFNSQSRRASLDVICNTEEISHLQTFAAAILAPINSLEAGGEVWGSMGTGLPQGDPASGAFQAFGLQPSLVRLDEECRAGGGMARAGADDICALARPEVAYAAVKRFSDEIWQRCGLEIRWDKSEVYQREGDLPDYAMAGLTLAGEEVDGDFLRGTVFFGVPIGSPEFVSHKLHQLKDSIVSDAVRTREVLGSDRQALWTALRLSVQQRFQYWMQLVPPSLCEPVAVELDAELWRVLEAATGFSIPRGEEEGGLCLRVPQVPSLDRCSYQEWVVRLPVRLYGWGLHSLADSCGPAYLGMLETALPYMGAGGHLPLLAESWGGPKRRLTKLRGGGCCFPLAAVRGWR